MSLDPSCHWGLSEGATGSKNTEGLVSFFSSSSPTVSVSGWDQTPSRSPAAAADGAWLSLFLCFLWYCSTLTSWPRATSYEAILEGALKMMYIKAKRETRRKKLKTILVMFVAVCFHIIIVSAKASWLRVTRMPILFFTGFVFSFFPILTFSPHPLHVQLFFFWGGGGAELCL